MRKFIAMALAIGLMALAAAPVASAHVYADKRTPKKGATVSKGLDRVSLKLSGQVSSGSIKVKKDSGGTVARGGLVNAVKLAANVSGKLNSGKYKVKVKLIAADGHEQKFSWPFKVR
jgi:methionine-rich copper-binding protein CopC